MRRLEKELLKSKTVKNELISRKIQDEEYRDWMVNLGRTCVDIENDIKEIDSLLELIDISEIEFISTIKKSKNIGLYSVMKDMLAAGCQVS